MRVNVQMITGELIDKIPGSPCGTSFVAAEKGSALTGNNGTFTLKICNILDTININTMGDSEFILASHMQSIVFAAPLPVL